MYSFTNVTAYLDTARSTAAYFLNRLPAGGVPYWLATVLYTIRHGRQLSGFSVIYQGLRRLDPDDFRYFRRHHKLLRTSTSCFYRGGAG